MIAEFFGTVITWFIMVPIYVVVMTVYVVVFTICVAASYLFHHIARKFNLK